MSIRARFICPVWFLAAPLALAGGAGLQAQEIQARQPVIFARTRDALKLLELRCVQCHQGAKPRGGLDLTTRTSLLQGGDGGPAIVAGDAPKSRLVRLIRHAEKPHMPQNGKKLSDDEVKLLAAWIEAGAPYDRSLGDAGSKAAAQWWSRRPVVKTPLPKLPARLQASVRNPVDTFILAKLQQKGLEPSPPADRRTLLRRVTFDLLGLPPTPKEMDAFLKDTAVDAFEKVVDRLLASPHYGERWARHWMDVIHFAETHGHDQDVPREHAWPYRDYLIASFNQDKPFARFVEEQIAGDVLYPRDPQATVALGFLAAGPWDESSLRDIREDSIDRKAAQYLDRDDMVGTVGLAFLSTTVQCARCHNHKFDPISQKEYFGLQAVFAGVDRANRTYEADPRVQARRQALLQRKKLLDSGAKDASKMLDDPTVLAQLKAWEKGRVGGRWKVLEPLSPRSAGGATITALPDYSLLFSGVRAERDTYTIEAIPGETTLTAVRLEVLADKTLPHAGPGRQDNGNLHLSEFSVEIAPATGGPEKRKRIAIASAFADFNQAGWGIERAIDGKRDTAWGIYPAVGKSHSAVFVFREPLAVPAGSRLIFTLDQLHGGGHLIGRPRLSVTSSPAPAALQPLAPGIEKILAKPWVQRTPAETAELVQVALRQTVDAELAALPQPKLVYAAAAEFAPEGSFRPFGGCRPVHVLRRGDIRQPLELAKPAFQFVPGSFRLDQPNDEGQRRAALARWISDPRNPLPWRSIVNRAWHHHFGRGLVSTPSDFGRMGALPTHPDLLDWLTANFIEEGGSLKKLHRLLVTSATYRQSYRPNPEAAKIDADNLLLWRANVQRLDAEMVRDAVLQISGKLDTTMGGPSVKHFRQSPGIHRTPKVDYAGFDPDSPGAHRRSVYRFVFRTLPDPFMDALDCPDASQFTAVRPMSVTALQALALLNDPFMVRMSEHFAKRIASAGTAPEQIRLAYRLALNREPTERERDRLVDFAARHGMPNACRVLLNCNEFVFLP